MASSPLHRPLLRRTLAALFGCSLAVALAEGVARSYLRPPRVQIIGPLVGVDLIRTPLGATWQPNEADVNSLSCPGGDPQPEDLHVVLIGSSIFYGAGLADLETRPGVALQRALAAKAPGKVCVEVVAASGSTFWTQLPLAQHKLSGRPKADLIVWELWYNSAHTLTDIGGALVNSGSLAAADGGPSNPLRLPQTLHYGLFSRSMAYIHLSLALAPERNVQLVDPWIRFLDEGLDEASRFAEERAEALVWLAMASLDKPFREQADAPAESYVRAAAALAEREVPMWSAAALWGDIPPESVRLDPCCHYNAAGAEGLAERLVEPILSAVAETGAP
ncbi:hypothetical protein L6R49_28315 [Myxococcota bacterium]|nr:hypothetical protein [Myxococcota bacterium]